MIAGAEAGTIPNPSETDRDMKKPIQVLLILAGGVLVLSCLAFLPFLNSSLWADAVHLVGRFGDREWVTQLVRSFGWGAPVAFIAIQMGQVVCAPIPGDVTGFLGGYLFGPWAGLLLSTVGLTIGSMLNFYIGRFLGERFVRRMFSAETFDKYDELVQYKGILVIFVFFLMPVFPKDYLCLFLGLTNLPARVFFVLSTVGRLPGTLALSLQGACIFKKNYYLFAGVTACCLLFAVVAYLTRDALYRWVARARKQRCASTTP